MNPHLQLRRQTRTVESPHTTYECFHSGEKNWNEKGLRRRGVNDWFKKRENSSLADAKKMFKTGNFLALQYVRENDHVDNLHPTIEHKIISTKRTLSCSTCTMALFFSLGCCQFSYFSALSSWRSSMSNWLQTGNFAYSCNAVFTILSHIHHIFCCLPYTT